MIAPIRLTIAGCVFAISNRDERSDEIVAMVRELEQAARHALGILEAFEGSPAVSLAANRLRGALDTTIRRKLEPVPPVAHTQADIANLRDKLRAMLEEPGNA